MGGFVSKITPSCFLFSCWQSRLGTWGFHIVLYDNRKAWSYTPLFSITSAMIPSPPCGTRIINASQPSRALLWGVGEGRPMMKRKRDTGGNRHLSVFLDVVSWTSLEFNLMKLRTIGRLWTDNSKTHNRSWTPTQTHGHTHNHGRIIRWCWTSHTLEEHPFVVVEAPRTSGALTATQSEMVLSGWREDMETFLWWWLTQHRTCLQVQVVDLQMFSYT